MTVFGDLDISTLRELPKGRAAITTHIVDESDKPHYLERAWTRIIEEVKTGAQAYIVAPRISAQASEEISQEDLITNALLGVVTAEDKQSMYAVDALFEQLTSGPLKSVRIAKLHGQLSADEKDLTMQKFSAGEIDVLVATTVIEVGVDVPLLFPTPLTLKGTLKAEVEVAASWGQLEPSVQEGDLAEVEEMEAEDEKKADGLANKHWGQASGLS
jgi:ATP-dependent DNA helicase RecG